ncbi:MAG: M55 family metallopeptidase [Anaerolineaceae bacterium]|nr:M55 family metallopeptidase [Anaerolineaceae bacterium]
MKLLIATDMEGISGVVNWDQVRPSHSEYVRSRKIMTGDVNAVVEGALRGGADEVIVADGHNNGYNILLEELDPRVRLHTGNAAPLAMVQGAGDDIDAAMFVGYHGRAGHPLAVLSHTWDPHILNVWLNEFLVGESGINAAVCGYFGAPLLLVSGDQGLAEEVSALIPGVETVVVKYATSYFSAECLPLSESWERLRKGAEEALRRFKRGGGPQPFLLTSPMRVTIEFSLSSQADSAMKMPGAIRLDGRKVQAPASDALAAYNLFRTLVQLSSI